MDSGILALEERLKAAMLSSDVAELNQLLSDDLIFTSHLGQTMSKQDDLEAHRSGFVEIYSIDQSEQRVQVLGDIGVISVLWRVHGAFGGEESEAALRFTRVWQKNSRKGWQVIAAHSSKVLAEAAAG